MKKKYYFEYKLNGAKDSECVVASNVRSAALKLIRFYGAGIQILHTYDDSMKEIPPKDIL